MAQAGYEWLEPPFTGVLANGADEAGAHKAAAGPGAVAYKVNASLDGLQAVVADFKIQRAQVLANRTRRRLSEASLCMLRGVVLMVCSTATVGMWA